MKNYNDIKEAFDVGECVIGINESGEKMVSYVCEEYAEIKVFQENGYVRIDTYYPNGRKEYKCCRL